MLFVLDYKKSFPHCQLGISSSGITDDLLSLESAAPYAVHLPDNCLRIVSPLVPDVWSSLLVEHPDRQFVEYLLRGLRGGFHVGCCASVQELQSAYNNMPSASRLPEVIDRYLRDKLDSGRLVEVPHPESNVVHVVEVWGYPQEASAWEMAFDC